MSFIFSVYRQGFVDYHGNEVKPIDEKFISPLETGGICPGLNSHCWILYQNWWGRWQIREEIVTEICYTNIWGYRMSNNWWIMADKLGHTLFLHDQLGQAKEECLKRNKMRSVKIKYMS